MLPYVGDGSLCALDSDGDNYPDRALSTCTGSDMAIYCSADTCPYALNPNQDDVSPCVGDETGTQNRHVYKHFIDTNNTLFM